MKLKVAILLTLYAASSFALADNSYYESTYNSLKPMKVGSIEEAELIRSLYGSSSSPILREASYMKTDTYVEKLNYKSKMCLYLTYKKAELDFVEINKEYFNSFLLESLKPLREYWKKNSDQNGYNCSAITALIWQENEERINKLMKSK